MFTSKFMYLLFTIFSLPLTVAGFELTILGLPGDCSVTERVSSGLLFFS